MMNISKIFFLLCILIVGFGCYSPKQQETLTNIIWKMPESPKNHHVEFVKEENMVCLNRENAYNLLLNKEENEVYIKKLELLISEMKKYYNVK